MSLPGLLDRIPTDHVPLRDTVQGLLFVTLPGLGFLVVLLLVSGEGRFPDLGVPGSLPWQLWAIAACGIPATAAGYLDWHYHATGRRVVGSGERRGELIALGAGGLPLFVFMCLASASSRPEIWLLPIIATFTFTTAMVCFDEFVLHRRACTRYETALHRTLVIGNGLAWAAWMHWIYVGG